MNLTELGKQIKKYREGMHLTQESLALSIDKSPNFISELERGIKSPSLETLIDIANVLEVTCDSLLKEDLIHKNEIVSKELCAKIERVDSRYHDMIKQLLETLLTL